MKETRIFTGDMDLNNAPEFVAEGNYGKAFNIRNRVTTGGDSGRVSFFNDFVPTGTDPALPEGYNKTLKAVVSDKEDLMYVFNFNSNGFHTLVEYSDNSSRILFTNKVDSGGEDLLKWDADTFLNDVVLHKSVYLILTDMVGEVLMFDLDKLKLGYGRVIKEQDITLAKSSPKESPEYKYADISSLGTNPLKNKLFKFKYKYIFEGGFESAWSPGSSEVLPNNLNNPISDPTTQNALRVKIKVDHDSVEKIVVVASCNGEDYVAVREVLVADLRQLPENRVTPLGETFSALGVWEMTFYKPHSYSILTADEIDHNYDAIPRKVNSLDIVNNTTLLLAGLGDTPDRLPKLDIELTPTTFSVPNYRNIIGRGTLKIEMFTRSIDPKVMQESYTLQLSGQPVVGDIVYINTNYGVGGTLSARASKETALSYIYEVPEDDTSLKGIYDYFYSVLENPTDGTNGMGRFISWKTQYAHPKDMPDYRTVMGVGVDLKDLGYTESNTYRTFKRGSNLKFALHYRDRFGRYLPLESDDSIGVSIPSRVHTESQAVGYEVSWKIKHQPPAGAETYQWMVSEDTKHLRYKELIAEFKPNLSKEGKYITFNVSMMNKGDRLGIPGFQYEFTPGDVAYMYSTWTANHTDEIPLGAWFPSGSELPVVGMDIVAVSEVNSMYLLKIDYNLLLWEELTDLIDSNNKELAVRMQIYTPTKVDVDKDSTVFREIGPSMNVVGGVHSVTQGKLSGIDDFIRGRVVEAFESGRVKSFLIEDRNVSDESKSLIPFRGNVRTFHDQLTGKDLSGSIRFSDTGNINSVYNGVNKFFEGRIYGEGPGETTSVYGAIRKIKVVGNYLKILQEDNVGDTPIYLSILQDNTGNIQTADSDRLLTTTRYLGGGKVGVGGDAKSFAISDRGVVFFFDNDRKVPYKLIGSTLQAIPGKIGLYLKKSVVDTLSGVCVGDSEYWLTYTDSEYGEITLIHNEQENSWTSFLTYSPDTSSRMNSKAYSFKNGVRFVMSESEANNNFFGETHPALLEAVFPANRIRAYKSLEVYSNTPPKTTEDGITTEMGHTSDLVEADFRLAENSFQANFLRDKATGLFGGKILKGNWLKVNLEFTPGRGPLDLIKVVVNSVE